MAERDMGMMARGIRKKRNGEINALMSGDRNSALPNMEAPLTRKVIIMRPDASQYANGAASHGIMEDLISMPENERSTDNDSISVIRRE
ncbi:hypothetical protein GcM1_248138 [Golovinomyces cichoracearum]|uniref:Uncharacterized protein n=1 Tax=Golovinomyces cichoracearum TaxID=62708 RepID=A0A420ID00_9PEZI|nr:hypothetical protein GcM1_248138 [Golovinomyces cichoracearum]